MAVDALRCEEMAAAGVATVVIPRLKPGPTAGIARMWAAGLPRLPAAAAAASAVMFLSSGIRPLGLAFAAAAALGLVIRIGASSRVRQGVAAAAESFARARLDLALGETLIAAFVLFGSQAWLSPAWPSTRGLIVACGLWLAAAAGSRLAPPRRQWVSLLVRLALLGFGLVEWERRAGAWSAGGTVVLVWLTLGLIGYRMALSACPDPAKPSGENLRWLALLAAGGWLFASLVQRQVFGTDDSRWYAVMLADMVAQTRAGLFPVFAGQSLYQFNGALYPLRIAPAFHYFGALLDLLTAHVLEPASLENLLLVLVGFCSLFSAYVCLAVLNPARRWLSCGLAVAFVACPGVMAIVINSNLYMSWMTVPFVPVVWLGTILSFRSGGLKAMLLLGFGLGMTWWGHSPIALWMTILAAVAQAVRVIVVRPSRADWRDAALGAALFAAVAAYPIGSVLLFPPEPGLSASDFQVASPSTVAYFLRQVFPAVLLPLSAWGRELSDFQAGYCIWALLFIAVLAAFRGRSPDARVLAAAAVAVAVLLTPIPGVVEELWRLVPAFVRNTTGNWVMNRLYLVLASATVFAVAAAARRPVLSQRAVSIVLAIGLIWSLAEARRFIEGGRALRRPAGSERTFLLPENIAVTRFSYLVFPKTPAEFSHGVVDPYLENRLLEPGTFAPFDSNENDARVSGKVVGRADFGPPAPGANNLHVSAAMTIEPGATYLLQFHFYKKVPVPGVLEVFGPHLDRLYALPDYGGEESFGEGGRHSPFFPLEDSTGKAETVSLDFYPKEGVHAVEGLLPYASVALIEYPRSALSVQVTSWMPYRARVRAAHAGWLETPRSYQASYVATVGGMPARVSKTPDDLVAVAVPAGVSNVELAYRAPAGLAFLWGVSAASIVGAFAVLSAGAGRHWLRSRGVNAE